MKWLPGGWGVREPGVTANGSEIPFRSAENVIKLDSDDGCITLNMLKTTELHTFKG